MKALVIIPTFDHGGTLAITLGWLARQTHRDFEALVIGDGVPDALLPVVREAVSLDARVRFVSHPKHERRGEPYRDIEIRASDADIVCYLTDRDIWFPDHLQQMCALLGQADYAHSLGVHVLPDQTLRAYACDLSQRGYRHMMQVTNDNRMPFSTFGHTRAAYERLPEGWATTPAGQWTDLHMFRKFIRDDGLVGRSGTAPTALTFPSPPRAGWTADERIAELQRWSARLSCANVMNDVRIEMLQATLETQRREIAQLADLIEMSARKSHTQSSSSFASLTNPYTKR